MGEDAYPPPFLDRSRPVSPTVVSIELEIHQDYSLLLSISRRSLSGDDERAHVNINARRPSRDEMCNGGKEGRGGALSLLSDINC